VTYGTTHTGLFKNPMLAMQFKSLYSNIKSISVLIVICILSFVILTGGIIFAQSSGETEVFLFFLKDNELELIQEKRVIAKATNTVEQVRLTITELINGPNSNLISTIPLGTTVREVFLDEKGCAYVDFSREISQNHRGGVTGELITALSIVNTMAINFPEEIRKVRILIDGKERKTIAGHIDISKPIFPLGSFK